MESSGYQVKKVNLVQPHNSHAISISLVDITKTCVICMISCSSNVICELSPNLGQYGVYELTVASSNCDIKVIDEPTYPYTGKTSFQVETVFFAQIEVRGNYGRSLITQY